MAFESEQLGGYPTQADIDDALRDRGIEPVTENNPDFFEEHMQELWGLLNAIDWVTALGVFCPTPVTFNVRSGKYLFGDTVKTFTKGDSFNPTDNDTTFVWMADDNTIDSAIDGTGWPATEHIKLAEIDVDVDGIITDVRDLRGETFLVKTLNALTGNHTANIGANGGIPFILTAIIAAGSTVVIHNANAPFKYRVLKAWSVATSADGGTWQVKNGANAITEAVTVTGTDKTINNAATIDDDYHEVAAGGSLSVVGATGADVIVYIECVKVA